MKKIISTVVSIVCTISIVSNIVNASISNPVVPKNVVGHIDVISYDPKFDYRQAMYDCALSGDEYSLAVGYIYEIQRNMKLNDMNMDKEKTAYFEIGKNARSILAEMVSDEMRKEYGVAGAVYEYFAKKGYSDVTISAILGNMMNETGGNTLNLNPYIYDPGEISYGLCQWSVYYCKEVINTDVFYQLKYLYDTIGPNMKQFGGSVEEFKAMEKPYDAAVYFCKYYERGENRGIRGENAEKAYKWILGFK